MPKELARAPIGLHVWPSATLVILLAACGEEETLPVQEVKVTLATTSHVENVHQLTLRLEDTVLTRDDGSATQVAGNTSSALCQVEGVPRACMSAPPAGGTYSQYENWWSVTIIDASHATAPLPKALVTAGVAIPQGTYKAVALSVRNDPAVRDSYLLLPDGRECEIDIRSRSGASHVVFPVTAAAVGAHENWHFGLYIDLSGNQIDPSQCTDGYVLYASPAYVEAATY